MTAKLYTRKGDGGATSLFSGRRAEKFDPRVGAVGDLDELSASVGLARLAYPSANDLLRSVQRALYTISAIVSAEDRPTEMTLSDAEVIALEDEIDRISERLPELREFIYPGADEASCRLHFARAVARRAERAIAGLVEPAAPATSLAFLNRLSDLLFVLARQADYSHGRSDATFKT
jgi:cob(I)alamin adenosyltransferase